MAGSRRKRKRRGRKSGSGGGGGGVMLGMRGGFKKVASSVTGTGAPDSGKRSWIGNAVLIVLVLAAAALLLARRF